MGSLYHLLNTQMLMSLTSVEITILRMKIKFQNRKPCIVQLIEIMLKAVWHMGGFF